MLLSVSLFGTYSASPTIGAEGYSKAASFDGAAGMPGMEAESLDDDIALIW